MPDIEIAITDHEIAHALWPRDQHEVDARLFRNPRDVAAADLQRRRSLVIDNLRGLLATTPLRLSLLPGIEAALFGAEDGGLIDDDGALPVGELRRLLREEWAGDRS